MIRTLVAAMLAGALASGCQRAEPPAPTPSAPSTVAARGVDSAPPVASAAPSPAPLGASAAAAPVSSAEPPREKNVVPALLDADGGVLPQTEDRPSGESPFFRELSRRLFAAIVHDDPKRAHDLFFPLEAYRQVKAIADPDRDYRRRLLANFERDIHAYHKRLGRDPERAELIAIDVPTERARWMKPGSEGNKLGYYRVLRSALRFRDADGKERNLELTSLISWRGQWYVVHIDGFR